MAQQSAVISAKHAAELPTFAGTNESALCAALRATIWTTQCATLVAAHDSADSSTHRAANVES